MTYAQVLKRFSNEVKRVGYKSVELSVRHIVCEYMRGRVAPACDVYVGDGDIHVSSIYVLTFENVPPFGNLVMQRRATRRALTATRFLEAEDLKVSVASGSAEELRADIKHYDEMIRHVSETVMYKLLTRDHSPKIPWRIRLSNNVRLNGRYERF